MGANVSVPFKIGELVKITGGHNKAQRRKVQGKYAIVVSDYYRNNNGQRVDVCVSEAGGPAINTHPISPYYLERVYIES